MPPPVSSRPNDLHPPRLRPPQHKGSFRPDATRAPTPAETSPPLSPIPLAAPPEESVLVSLLVDPRPLTPRPYPSLLRVDGLRPSRPRPLRREESFRLDATQAPMPVEMSPPASPMPLAAPPEVSALASRLVDPRLSTPRPPRRAGNNFCPATAPPLSLPATSSPPSSTTRPMAFVTAEGITPRIGRRGRRRGRLRPCTVAPQSSPVRRNASYE